MQTIEQPTLPLPLPVLPGGDGAVRGGSLETTGGPVGSTAGENRKIFFPNGAPGLAKRLGGWWEAVESVASELIKSKMMSGRAARHLFDEAMKRFHQ